MKGHYTQAYTARNHNLGWADKEDEGQAEASAQVPGHYPRVGYKWPRTVASGVVPMLDEEMDHWHTDDNIAGRGMRRDTFPHYHHRRRHWRALLC